MSEAPLAATINLGAFRPAGRTRDKTLPAFELEVAELDGVLDQGGDGAASSDAGEPVARDDQHEGVSAVRRQQGVEEKKGGERKSIMPPIK